MSNAPTQPPVVLPRVVARPIARRRSSNRLMVVLLLLVGLGACTALGAALVITGQLSVPAAIQHAVIEPDHAEREAVRRWLRENSNNAEIEEVKWHKMVSLVAYQESRISSARETLSQAQAESVDARKELENLPGEQHYLDEYSPWQQAGISKEAFYSAEYGAMGIMGRNREEHIALAAQEAREARQRDKETAGERLQRKKGHEEEARDLLKERILELKQVQDSDAGLLFVRFRERNPFGAMQLSGRVFMVNNGIAEAAPGSETRWYMNHRCPEDIDGELLWRLLRP